MDELTMKLGFFTYIVPVLAVITVVFLVLSIVFFVKKKFPHTNIAFISLCVVASLAVVSMNIQFSLEREKLVQDTFYADKEGTNAISDLAEDFSQSMDEVIENNERRSR